MVIGLPASLPCCPSACGPPGQLTMAAVAMAAARPFMNELSCLSGSQLNFFLPGFFRNLISHINPRLRIAVAFGNSISKWFFFLHPMLFSENIKMHKCTFKPSECGNAINRQIQKQARKGFWPPSAMKGMGYFQNLRIYLDISGNFLEFFRRIFFWRNFFGGISLEEFFGRIFLGGFFWEDFLGGFCVRNLNRN